MFFKGSRYEKVAELKIIDKNGREIKYIGMRFTPDTPADSDHEVKQGNRLDIIANTYLNDPELFWYICDANEATVPDELTQKTGRRIQIPSSLR